MNSLRNAAERISRRERLRGYLSHGRSVHGWLDRYSAVFISELSHFQSENGIVGSLGEIGVHMGRLFILLRLTAKADEGCFALDVFGEQHLNVDNSGFGDRDAFLRNVRQWTGDTNIAVIQSSSLDVEPADIVNAVGQCRLVSIDGGHTEEIAYNDLRLTEAILGKRGVAILDDFFNQSWPGVAAGAARYFLDPLTTIRPFAVSPNKLYLAAPACHGFYRTGMQCTQGMRFEKTVCMFGHDVDVFGCQALSASRRIRRIISQSRLGPGVRLAKKLLKAGMALSGRQIAA